MDRATLSRLDVGDLFDSLGVDWQDEGKNISSNCVGVCCPFCGDDGYHCGVFRDYKNFTCWKCSRVGSLWLLLRELVSGLTYDEYLRMVSSPKTLPGTVAGRVAAIFAKQPEQTVSAAPVEVVPPGEEIWPNTAKFFPGLLPFLRRRNITLGACARYSARYQTAGQYAARMIIPVYNEDVCVGFQARDVTDTADTKYLIPPGVKLNNYLYNFDYCSNGYVFFVEGPLDVWRMGPGSVCTFGTHVTDNQMRLLSTKPNIKHAVLLWDSDAYWKARVAAEKMSHLFDDITIVKLPDGSDPDSLGQDETYRLIGAALGID